VADAAKLLLDMLTTPGLPSRVAVHGRLGAAARWALAPSPARDTPQGRFLETVREHYPGVELVADTSLSLRADPYLADHRIDGLAVLPAAMVLEAMAQAASALAGTPLRQAREVSLAAPVVLPTTPGGGQTVIRVCALSRGDEVETVLRCDETRFRVDHARAVFLAAGHGGPRPGPGGLATGSPAAGGASTGCPAVSGAATGSPAAGGAAGQGGGGLVRCGCHLGASWTAPTCTGRSSSRPSGSGGWRSCRRSARVAAGHWSAVATPPPGSGGCPGRWTPR
jgi:Polyketide synthase dehydratase domain